MNCGLEAHRDVAGVINMGTLHDGGMPIRLVAQPLLLRWNRMRWEPKRAMSIRPMNTLEARISPLKRESVKVRFLYMVCRVAERSSMFLSGYAYFIETLKVLCCFV